MGYARKPTKVMLRTEPIATDFGGIPHLEVLPACGFPFQCRFQDMSLFENYFRLSAVCCNPSK